MSESGSLTDLLRRAGDGDAAAVRRAFEATYEELRDLAHARLRRAGRGTVLNTTALVHESYLRFVNAGRLQIEDREHFLRYAAHVMRSVIVDFIREKGAERRGGDQVRVTLDAALADSAENAAEEEILGVHEALEELAQLDERLVQVVEMRYFVGLSEEEIAAALGVHKRTVRRDWAKARLLLAEALRSK
jgi:RNA polymerase sigma factor (TIGR02999 family)